ncbi:hypothetical protein ACSBOB_18605 [Mesorhizobium sp. ASY16-5R]|uniref:hypothetical protein n=1 Tax=Mesorhizobium sp. ASY16-5R TaxID=3445772 RepID=UPI003FA02FEE
MTKRPQARPAPAAESDPRAVKLAEIDAELARLKGLRRDKAAIIDADAAKHALDQNWEYQKRLTNEINAFRQKIEALEAQRLQVELADDNELAKPVTQTKTAPASPSMPWEINPAHREMPEYPYDAKYGDAEFEAAYDAFQDWSIATMSRVYEEHGILADSKVSFRTLAMIIGSISGMVKFGEVRIQALEQQFAKAADPLKTLADRIEEGGLRPMTYRGTFKAGTAYRPGDMVTHAGSMFHCDRATSSIPEEYGAERAWTLAVKRGKDATR